MGLSSQTEINTADNYLLEINESILEIEKRIQSINSTTYWLRKYKWKNESYKQLDELEDIYNKYLSALEQLKTMKEGTIKFVKFQSQVVKITGFNDEFNAHYDLSITYIDEDKFDKALIELEKSVPFQEKIVEVRKEQLKDINWYNLEIISTLYLEDNKYLEYLNAKRTVLLKLKENSNIPKSERFKESDPIYDEYNELYVRDSEYSEAIEAWIYDNVHTYWDKSKDILTEADIKYNSFIKDFRLDYQ